MNPKDLMKLSRTKQSRYVRRVELMKRFIAGGHSRSVAIKLAKKLTKGY